MARLPPPVVGYLSFSAAISLEGGSATVPRAQMPHQPPFLWRSILRGLQPGLVGPLGLQQPKAVSHKRVRAVPDASTRLPQHHPHPFSSLLQGLSQRPEPLRAPSPRCPRAVAHGEAARPHARPNPTGQAARSAPRLRGGMQITAPKTYSEWHARSVPALPIVSGKQKCLSKYQLESELAASGGIKEPCWQAQD